MKHHDGSAPYTSPQRSRLEPPQESNQIEAAASRKVSRRTFLRTSGLTVGAAALLPLAGVGGEALARSLEAQAARPIANPDELFRLGRFKEADRAYRRLLGHDPANAHVAGRIGYIALLSNHFEDAEGFLTRATELAPEDNFSKLQLADTFVRQDQLARAVPLLRGLDERSRALAEVYAGMTGTPYEVRGAAKTRLPFPSLDPLPHFDVSVNGGAAEPFLFDTGATIGLTSEIAQRAGLRAVASSTQFVNGRTIVMSHGVVDSLRFGDIELRNVPLTWGDLPPLPLPDGSLPSGVVGTDIFYRLLTTLDYAQQGLILRQKTRAQLREFRTEALRAHAEILPLWLATDHLACTLGSLNEYGPRVVLLDTGGVGIGLVTTEEFAQLSGIEADYANPLPGGFFSVVADKMSLGDAVRRHMPGVIGPRLADQFTFEVIGGFTHEFYKPFAVTFDFVDMNLYITGDLR
jgi:hypothetical protein